MFATLVFAIALMAPALDVPRPWVGDAFLPGETVSYAHPFHHLKDGHYAVTVVDELGKETTVPGTVLNGDLEFACPRLKYGFYEIAEVQDERTGKEYFGKINGSQGFYIQSPR